MTTSRANREPGGRRFRVLFVAEAVTLAHVARPIALGAGLTKSTSILYWLLILATRPSGGASRFR